MVKVLAEVTGSISFSQRGDKGQKGALMREHDGFESGSYKYLSGAGEEEYVDVVCVKGKWYQCTKTYDDDTSSPSLTDGHWIEMSNYKSIATHLLLAENATINMLGSNQVNLYNPSGGAMFGSFRVVDNDDDYAFWLGGNTGAAATTSITRGGKLTAKDAVITGTINATSGQIGGLKITDAGLSVGSYSSNDKGWELKNGIVLEHSSLWLARTNSCVREVAAGMAADSAPVINSDGTVYHRNQRACDMYGSALERYAKNNAMIIRKYSLYDYGSGDYQTVRDYSDPSAAALNVDTDGGIGIRSIGGNLLGCIAQNVISMSVAGDREQNAINNNRVGIILMTNSKEVDLKLPKNPMTGQMLIVIQGNSRIYFDPVVSGRRLYCCGKIHTTSDKFYSDDVGQFNILIWDGYNWQLQYIYH